jgi:hypothetical protein
VQRELAVLDVLFPRVRASMLRLLFSKPSKQRYVRELMTLSGFALCTVQDELRKLSAVGLVTSWSNGYQRYIQANPKHPMYDHLVNIVQTSERLPATKRTSLYRTRLHRGRRDQHLAAMRPDRLVKWNLFSKRPRRKA